MVPWAIKNTFKCSPPNYGDKLRLREIVRVFTYSEPAEFAALKREYLLPRNFADSPKVGYSRS